MELQIKRDKRKYTYFSKNCKEKRQPRKPRNRWLNNIKTGRKEIGCKEVVCFYVTLDREQGSAVVKKV